MHWQINMFFIIFPLLSSDFKKCCDTYGGDAVGNCNDDNDDDDEEEEEEAAYYWWQWYF